MNAMSLPALDCSLAAMTAAKARIQCDRGRDCQDALAQGGFSQIMCVSRRAR
jgi:hypothetical protein